MAVTMKDIAEIAGVSIGTVDRALNNRGRIKPEVAERIRSIASQMNYRTNTVAKSLALRNKQISIAVVFHIQGNDYFDEVVIGIKDAESEIADFGIEIKMYYCHDFDPEDQLAQINKALEDGAGSLVIVPINHPLIISKLHDLKRQNIPVIFLNSIIKDAPHFSSVHASYSRSGRMAGSMLRFVSGGKGDVLAFFSSITIKGHRHRVDSFIDYINQCCPDLHLLDSVELPNDRFDTYRIVGEYLKANPTADCLLFNGSRTDAFLKAINDSGRTFSTVTFDLAEVTRDALLNGYLDSTIETNPRMQGYRSIMLLFDYLTAGTIPPNEVVVDSQIIIKESIE